MATRVVHFGDKVKGGVYIGRHMPRLYLPGSPFRNPYKIGRDYDRAEAITAYRRYLSHNLHLVARLPELRDKALICWCRHDGQEPSEKTACHGDVLVDLLNRYTDDELRRLTAEDVNP